MRRTLATLLLALLTVATSVGSTAAAKPPSADPGSPAPSPSATPDPTPTPVPTPLATETPSSEPSPSVTPPPDAEPTPTATAAASPTEAPPETAPPSADPAASAQTPTVADPTPTVDPSLEPSPEPGASDPADPSGRYIVMLADGADPTAVVGRHQKREGTKADRTFQRAFRGFSAKLDKRQREALLADPTVVAVVPDEKIELTAQTVPTGVSRIGGRLSSVADIDGLDTRVDADIAIVDTGIQRVADLNVAGGYNCSSSTRTAWQDPEGHGTHVAGTAAALDNNIGVVGVAPGARLWAVRILDSSGSGLLSWYVCGLDWILAQRDPDDPSQPLIEVVNMSVTKWGRDDLACGAREQRRPACRDLPPGQGRDHRRRGRGQRQRLGLQARPGVLQRGHHRLRAGRHGWEVRLAGRQPLLLMGRLRQRRHVRQLQQLRRRRRHHGAGQVHLVDPAHGRLRLHERHEHGLADRRRRRGAVPGQPTVGDPGRRPGSAPVPRQLQLPDVDRPGRQPRQAARRRPPGSSRVVRLPLDHAERDHHRRRWDGLGADPHRSIVDPLRACPVQGHQPAVGLERIVGTEQHPRLLGQVDHAQRHGPRGHEPRDLRHPGHGHLPRHHEDHAGERGRRTGCHLAFGHRDPAS